MEKFVPQNMEEVNKIKTKLKECKEEWIKKKPGNKESYISHNTIRQILDSAVKGITYWDFHILEQWKEEVYAYDKNSRSYYFDGHVYHVRGVMHIPGLGKKEQFGSKPALGGKNNQDSAYKAAASNCFAKCASLFGVGENIYSKILLEEEDETASQNQSQQMMNQGYQNQQSAWNQQPVQNNWNNQQASQQMMQNNQNQWQQHPQAQPMANQQQQVPANQMQGNMQDNSGF